MLVGSRRTRKTRHSKRACHRTRHSRGTWKRTETFTYHGKRWSKPYIPIQHRSINRANTDKREISIGRLQILLSRRKTFAVIASGGNYREDHRRFSSPSRPSCVSSPISHYYEGTYERYFPLQDYLILTVRLFSHAWDSNAFTWETLTFHWWDNRIIYKGYDLSCRHATCRSIGKCRFSSRLAEIRPATLRWTRSLIFGRKSKQRTSSLLYSPHDSFDSTRE